MACLGLLGIGAGIWADSAAPMSKSAAGIAPAAGLWLSLSGLVAFYAGGWVTGRMMAGARDMENVIHGLLCWSTATFAFLLLCSVAAGPKVESALATIVPNSMPSSDLRRPGERSAPAARRVAEAGAKKAGTLSLLGFLCFSVEGMGAALGAYAGGRGWNLPLALQSRRTIPSKSIEPGSRSPEA